MTPAATTLVQPRKAPIGRAPEQVGAPRYITLDRPERPRYYTEAWRLTDGEIIFVVAHNNGRSMDHHTGEIEDLTHRAWDIDAAVSETTIILDWRDAEFMRDRLRILVRDGLSDVFDQEAWTARGVVFGAV
jgi:hypothetical protein